MSKEHSGHVPSEPKNRAKAYTVNNGKEDGMAQREPFTEVPPTRAENALEKRVGLFSGCAIIVGTMIGSGIFASPTGVMESSGSVGMCLFVWIFSGVIAMLGALSYIELGCMIPKSGAEYVYFHEAFGPVIAYLFAWTCLWVIKPVLVTAIMMTFSQYFLDGFLPYLTSESFCSYPAMTYKLFTITVILFIAFINCMSVSWATKVQNIFTVCKLLAVAFISIVGVIRLFYGHFEYLEEPFKGTIAKPFSLSLAFYMGLWSYDGWNNLNYITEEIKNPNKNLPRAIWIALPLTTICYVITIVSYLTAVSKGDMLNDKSVGILFGARTLPASLRWVIPLFVCASTFGAANGSMLSGSRLVYATAREGHIPHFFSYIHIGFKTPLPAIMFTTVLSNIYVLMADFESLVNYFSFTAWVFYMGAVAALLWLRYKQPKRHRPYKVFIVIPIIFVVLAMYLIVAPVINKPDLTYLYALLFVLSGLLFYYPFVVRQMVLPGWTLLANFGQKALNVAPSDQPIEIPE